MTRVTILSIFCALIVAVINLKGDGDLKVEKTYFNLEKYEESYKKEVELIAELSAPKEQEVVLEEVAAPVDLGPVLELTTESQLSGQKLYRKCITCHGKHANGKKSQKAPKLAGQYDWYIADKIKQMQDGIWENKVMYPYIKNLSNQDIKDLAAFLSAYQW